MPDPRRIGLITASRFADAVSKGAARKTYLLETVFERMSGSELPQVTAKPLQWGLDHEDEAVMAVEDRLALPCYRSEFIKMPSYPIGASPDRWVQSDVGLEVKCPYNPTVHLRTMISGKVPVEHVAQIQGGMMVTGADAWIFASFDPRLPSPYNLFLTKVIRDEDFIASMFKKLIDFNVEVEETILKIRNMQR